MKTGENRSPDKLDRALLAGWQAPDLLGIGVVVCDASCQMLIANQTALDILAVGDGLCLSSDGRLHDTEEGAQTVADLVRRCAGRVQTSSVTGRGSISARVGRTAGRAPLTLLARPFRSMPEGPGGMALLLVLDFPHAINEDGIAPLLRLLTASQSWSRSHDYREGVQ